MRLPDRLTEALCDRLSPTIWRRPPDFTVGADFDPYLLRWYLIKRNRVSNVYLHQFIRSDEDRALHDHMYANVSLILGGSYVEHFADGRAVIRRAGDIVFRLPSTLHRVSLVNGRDGIPNTVLTLFVTGPRVRQWGFQCPQGWVPWTEFVNPDHPGLPGRGCGDA